MFFLVLFRLPFENRNQDILEKEDTDIFDAINGFGISEFSDIFNMLSLCIYEFFYALNFAISKMLSCDRFFVL